LSRERFSALEFVIVIAIAFGDMILQSLRDVISGDILGSWTRTDLFGDSETISLVVYELLLAPGIVAVLYVGGWRPRDFRLGITWATTAVGVVIAVAVYVADWLIAEWMKLAFPSIRPMIEVVEDYKPLDSPGWTAIVLLSVVNPLYEEVIVCGYVIEALRRRFGDIAAANASAVIRGAYHLYQGFAILPLHLVYGLVQAHAYLRLHALWPLIVSHAILDFSSMVYMRR
jgi:membrane protease YdiL (CAAX protease family)